MSSGLSIRFYDSLRGEKIPFDKALGEVVKMYVCGPTVYDFAHLGHGRSAVSFDLVRRFLEFVGYSVEFVSNFTDIDDKMIDRAVRDGCTVPELAARIIPEYDADYAALGIKKPTHQPRATEYVEAMITLIEILEKKGHTYLLKDGVYFDITTFTSYGQLSHQKLAELNAGARVDERTDKRNHQDFVLWKFKKEGEPFWASPWGDGRPGWHIECSAMSSSLLGNHFDIHGGGLDLKFPHHECELAQSEAASGQALVDIWMHNGYITVDSEKMSKSLNNFFTLKDILGQWNPRVVRFFLISTHYRSPIEYSTELLEQARQTLKTLDEFFLTHRDGIDSKPDAALIEAFTVRLANDMDISGALADLFEWMKTAPQGHVESTLRRLNDVLGVFPVDFALSPQVESLLAARQTARQNKDWTQADALRAQLLELGIECNDGPNGILAKPRI